MAHSTIIASFQRATVAVLLVHLTTGVAASQGRNSAALSGAGTPLNPEACSEGVVFDDSSAETGYGWVPSVIDGEYVQEVTPDDLMGLQYVDSVCVCLLRTTSDATVDFRIVLYEQDEEGAPEAEPFADIPASAIDVPLGVPGQFYEVPTPGLRLPDRPVFLGARWNPSQDPFFFFCSDSTPTTPLRRAYFRDDRAEGQWTAVADSIDPIFDEFRALMFRIEPNRASAIDVPSLSRSGAMLLVLLLVIAGLWLTRGAGSGR